MNTNIIYINSNKFTEGLQAAAGYPKLMAVNADQLAGLNTLKNDPKVLSMVNNEQQITQNATIVDMPTAQEPKEEMAPLIIETAKQGVAVPTGMNNKEELATTNMPDSSIMQVEGILQESVEPTPVSVSMEGVGSDIDIKPVSNESQNILDIPEAINNPIDMKLEETKTLEQATTTEIEDDYREQMAANAELQKEIQAIFDTAKRQALDAVATFLEKNTKKKIMNNQGNNQPIISEPMIDLGSTSVMQVPTPGTVLEQEMPASLSATPEIQDATVTVGNIPNEAPPAIDLQPMGVMPSPIPQPAPMSEVVGQNMEQNGPVLARVA